MEDNNSILDKIITQQRDSDIAEFDPAEVKKTLFSVLKPREEDVLTKRFGLTGKKKMTLEEIGKSYHVTRERIRQIEIFAIKKLITIAKKNEQLSAPANTVRLVLQRSGGIREQENLLEELVSHLHEDSSHKLTEEERQAFKNFFTFALNHLWGDEFVKICEDDWHNTGWHLPSSSLEELTKLLKVVTDIITSHDQPIHGDKLVDKIKDHDFWNEYIKNHPNQIPQEDFRIIDQLRISKVIGENIFNEWGLATSSAIKPKRMTDKIYLVLKQHGKPMHFRDITSMINDVQFDYKKAYPPTIHNELILDKRYVLIGRGIYALSEWGYYPGTVADVIERILKEKESAMSKDAIIKEVLEQRKVNNTTINLALTNKKRFTKDKENNYSLVAH